MEEDEGAEKKHPFDGVMIGHHQHQHRISHTSTTTINRAPSSGPAATPHCFCGGIRLVSPEGVRYPRPCYTLSLHIVKCNQPVPSSWSPLCTHTFLSEGSILNQEGRRLYEVRGEPFLVNCGMGVMQQALGVATIAVRISATTTTLVKCCTWSTTSMSATTTVLLDVIIMRGGEPDCMLGSEALNQLAVNVMDLGGQPQGEMEVMDPLSYLRVDCLNRHMAGIGTGGRARAAPDKLEYYNYYYEPDQSCPRIQFGVGDIISTLVGVAIIEDATGIGALHIVGDNGHGGASGEKQEEEEPLPATEPVAVAMATDNKSDGMMEYGGKSCHRHAEGRRGEEEEDKVAVEMAIKMEEEEEA